jgi:hypothetical protein
MSFMLLRKLDGKWVNLYPHRDEGNPPEFKTRGEAEEHADRIFRTIGIRCRVVPRAEALKHEVPRRW